MKAPSRFLEAVVALAMEAGKKILEIYRTRFRVGRTADQAPFTAADLVSHHFLTERLHALSGNLPVLSEQSEPPPFEERSAWETFWLVDPLEGVAGFIDRSGEFTVNIALIHQNKPVLGVVYAPALQICYFAAEGCGAFKKTGEDEPAPISVRMQAPEHAAILAGRSHNSPEFEAFLRRLGETDFHVLESSLKFCRIAEGDADLFSRIGMSFEWNTAAGQCIIEEAGGVVTDLQGNPLLYNAKPSLVNPFFLAYGDKTRNWRQAADGIQGSPAPAPLPPSPLLKAVIALATEAGERIMGIYRSNFRIGRKADQSPLTAADLVSHHYLSEALETLNGRYPVWSEDSPDTPFEERRNWETYWLIDPLNGAQEFVNRNGEFTVNIALIRDHRPVLGVIYAPAMRVCYFAGESGGAFKKTGACAHVEIHVRQPVPRPAVILCGRSKLARGLGLYLSRIGEHELKPIGSSLKFCQIAEGEGDLSVCIGPSREWETAAAQRIVEAAGGELTDLHGNPLRYNTKASPASPCFLAYGDKTKGWRTYAEALEPRTDSSPARRRKPAASR